jgi:glycosyltransferase involved in cell wall biosynthesis
MFRPHLRRGVRKRSQPRARRGSIAADRIPPNPVQHKYPLVVHVVTRMNIGGPAVQIREGSKLLATDFESIVLCGRGTKQEGRIADLTKLEHLQVIHIRGLLRSPGLGDLAAFLSLVYHLKILRPDVVHTHTSKGGILGRLAAFIACPSAMRVHSYHFSMEEQFNYRVLIFVRTLELFFCKITHKIVWLSPTLMSRSHSAGLRVQCEEVIFPPVIAQPLAAGENRPTAIPRLLFVGRLNEIKRPLAFVRLIKQLHERGLHVHGEIVGDGPLRGEIEREIGRYNLQDSLEIAGWQEDVRPFYGAASLLVLTSRSEGTPLAIIEAMAAGVPIVAPSIGGIPDIVHSGTNGLLVDPELNGLADAVEELLRNTPLRAQMSCANRVAASEYYGAEARRKLIDLYGGRRLLAEGIGRTNTRPPQHSTLSR